MFKQVAADYDLSLCNRRVRVLLPCSVASTALLSSCRMKLAPWSACTALPTDLPWLQRTPSKPSWRCVTRRFLIHLWKFFRLFSFALVQTSGDLGSSSEPASRWLSCDQVVVAALSEITAVSVVCWVRPKTSTLSWICNCLTTFYLTCLPCPSYSRQMTWISPRFSLRWIFADANHVNGWELAYLDPSPRSYQLQHIEFSDCRTAADVCQRMIRSPAYSYFPNLCTFAKIALTIPSMLKRIKTSSRNSLVNIPWMDRTPSQSRNRWPLPKPERITMTVGMSMIASICPDLFLTLQTTWSRTIMTQMVTLMALSLQTWSTATHFGCYLRVHDNKCVLQVFNKFWSLVF